MLPRAGTALQAHGCNSWGAPEPLLQGTAPWVVISRLRWVVRCGEGRWDGPRLLTVRGRDDDHNMGSAGCWCLLQPGLKLRPALGRHAESAALPGEADTENGYSRKLQLGAALN